MSWKKPATVLEHVTLTKKLWYDIWKRSLFDKKHSRYFQYVSNMMFRCPMCDLFRTYCDEQEGCQECFLEDCNSDDTSFDKWYYNEDITGAKEIYLKALAEEKRLMKKNKK